VINIDQLILEFYTTLENWDTTKQERDFFIGTLDYKISCNINF